MENLAVPNAKLADNILKVDEGAAYGDYFQFTVFSPLKMLNRNVHHKQKSTQDYKLSWYIGVQVLGFIWCLFFQNSVNILHSNLATWECVFLYM